VSTKCRLILNDEEILRYTSEKDQRFYAAVEALKLGLGQSYIAKCWVAVKRKFIELKELAELPDNLNTTRQSVNQVVAENGTTNYTKTLMRNFYPEKQHSRQSMDEGKLDDLTPDAIAKRWSNNTIKVSKSVRINCSKA
jgi:hypothetical protein